MYARDAKTVLWLQDALDLETQTYGEFGRAIRKHDPTPSGSRDGQGKEEYLLFVQPNCIDVVGRHEE